MKKGVSKFVTIFTATLLTAIILCVSLVAFSECNRKLKGYGHPYVKFYDNFGNCYRIYAFGEYKELRLEYPRQNRELNFTGQLIVEHHNEKTEASPAMKMFDTVDLNKPGEYTMSQKYVLKVGGGIEFVFKVVVVENNTVDGVVED
ncbi:MAG: hypothetical protein HFE35_00400 [Clostridia bacterium]|uniref:hypothetical protein n=1 Tax=Pumilibacter muris TaxID=2941510 RepID=UPI00203E7D50|nr:hypothetical protein [Pumilibacter muris]MCI8595264.1 hypothetical protein [Clostridia bacterium]